MTKPEDMESFFNQIKEKYGKLNVLINNAGIISNGGKQADMPIEEYKKIMDTNMNGAWYTLKYGVKLMEQGLLKVIPKRQFLLFDGVENELSNEWDKIPTCVTDLYLKRLQNFKLLIQVYYQTTPYSFLILF